MSSVVTPLKPKDPTKVRICIVMRKANTTILCTRHVMPTVEDVITDLNGAKVMSKLDLSHAYHQLMLSEGSRPITTFSANGQLFRFKRLFVGICSAAEIFHRTIAQVLNNISGCLKISDDIIIHGHSIKEHDKNLRAVIERLTDSGLTLNKNNSELNKTQLEFYGLLFTQEGVKISSSRLETIKKREAPRDVTETKSFLGMANWISRFLNDYATLSAPLRQLTKQNVTWNWGRAEENAFQCIQNGLRRNISRQHISTNRR